MDSIEKLYYRIGDRDVCAFAVHRFGKPPKCGNCGGILGESMKALRKLKSFILTHKQPQNLLNKKMEESDV